MCRHRVAARGLTGWLPDGACMNSRGSCVGWTTRSYALLPCLLRTTGEFIRRIAEPSVGENGGKIRELTGVMRAEKDIGIRNGAMAVLGVRGHSTETASDFADADRRTVQLWAAGFNEGGIGGLRDVPGRSGASRAGYGRIGRLADGPAGRNVPAPGKLRNRIRGRTHVGYGLRCARDPALPRVPVQGVSYPVLFGCRRRHGRVVAGRRRRHGIWCKEARVYDRGAGRVHISQDGDGRREAGVARRGSRDRLQGWREGPGRRVWRAYGGRNRANAVVWTV